MSDDEKYGIAIDVRMRCLETASREAVLSPAPGEGALDKARRYAAFVLGYDGEVMRRD